MWEAFLQMDEQSRAVVAGVVASLLLALIKLVWKGFAASPTLVKFLAALLLAGAGGYATGGWAGAALAMVVALGTYDGGKNLLKTAALATTPE